MKKLLAIYFIILSQGVFSQKLEDCSLCDQKSYSTSDLTNNQLYEIQLLRNEIFARHHYQFQNQRLDEHFSRFDWYTPGAATFSADNLNLHEKHNVELFKERETEIKAQRKQLENELRKFQSAIKNNDAAYLKTVLSDPAQYDGALSILKDVFSGLDVSNLSWFKGQSLYSVTVDNGDYISERKMYIMGKKLSFSVSVPMAHSSVMDGEEAFEYPSEYYSEGESTQVVELIFSNNKLRFLRVVVAG
ncbi:YARHG domain-containing protein [Fulvivirga ligni]|uniref:YARHG domain-containing protein n=1 Tax=Fulvivirga ligni TaxID=2904246 RepID=UPI001F2226F7|nr:YARHG domain-containing protein [Fulvivirga ligni]UII20288.1 YARHG domain-containing protein [Fulvivirga ligni]